MNHLPSSFYSFPRFANTTMIKSEVQETLLETDGFIMANGSLWNIKTEELGAEIYKLSLEKSK